MILALLLLRSAMPDDCACGSCPECLEAQREHDEFLAWQQTPEGRITAEYLAQRAKNGFRPRDPNPELDALLAGMTEGK